MYAHQKSHQRDRPWQWRYKPWGELRAGTNETGFQFTGQRWEEAIGLYDYKARWYDPSIMMFTSPDTLVPDPYSPLDWNRYLYARANPLKYSDPSGHIPVDIIVDLLFLAYDVGAILIEGPTPMNQAALAADAVCAVIPYGTGGGLAVRLGGEAAIQGVTHLPAGIRALQASEKVVQFSKNLEETGPSSPTRKTYTDLEDAQREVTGWGVDKNLANSDQSHLDAVLKEQRGEQVIPGKDYNHTREVQSARNGLSNALNRLDNALRSPGWNDEARNYLLQQKKSIQDRIDLIDNVLGN